MIGFNPRPQEYDLAGGARQHLPFYRLCARWDVLSVMYITDSASSSFFRVCLGEMKSDAPPDQLITFTRCLYETLPIQYRDLLSAALNQTGTFQLAGSIRDGWPLDTQRLGEKVLGDRQCVPVTAVAHHEHPTRQPLLEAVRTVARTRHHDLLQKGEDVSGHEISEGRHRDHRSCEGRARHLSCAPRDLDDKPNGGTLGPEEGAAQRVWLTGQRAPFRNTIVGLAT
jgi:hypothetical protein